MTELISKKVLIVILILLIVVLVLGIWLGIKFLGRENPEAPSKYSVVYLQTGDIYFGKLSWFPWLWRLSLKNVWLVQRVIDQQNQTQLNVVPLKNSFWGPIDKIYLNPKQVIFWTNLRKDSQLIKVLENPNILNSTVQNQQMPQLEQQLPQDINQNNPAVNQQNKLNTEQATSSGQKR